jgi:DNA-directed RNA polymerase beta' subunit
MGHIDLQVPVVSGLFASVIHKIMNCLCICCGTLLVTLDASQRQRLMHLAPKKRTTDMSNRSLRKRGPCLSCGHIQPIYWQLHEHLIPRPVWSSKLVEVAPPVITITHVPELLRLVHPEDAMLFGILSPSRIEDVYFWKFPIPPVLMRPSRSGRSQDDLSTRLRLIIKANTKHVLAPEEINLSMRQVGDSPRTVVDIMAAPANWKPRFQRTKITIVPFHLETYFELQRQCAAFQDSRLYQKTDMDYGRELSSIRHRFCATRQRRGRIRDNILGKRGDFTARGVAVPCDYIDPHEVALPLSVCMNLTMDEKVCSFNYDRLLRSVQNGPDHHPGANFLRRGKQTFKLPMFCHEGLQFGDVVSRHLVRGDMILVNRQPSLHRFSILGYRVVPVDRYTIGLNLSVTPALNLDFDGDEVNAMLCRNMNSLAEAHTLVAVEQNMFKDGHLLIKFVQHACLGVYLLTLDPIVTTLSRALVQQLSWEAKLPILDLLRPEEQSLSGRDLAMRLVPGYDGTTPIDKSLLNKLAGQYLETSLLEPLSRSQWVGATSRFFNAYLMHCGSTIGHTDCSHGLTSSTQKRIEEVLEVVHTDVDEHRIIRTLDRIRDLVGTEVRQSFDAKGTNHLLNIVRSGAKGNLTHVVQNAGMVGQQLDGNSRRPTALVSHDVNPLLQRGFVRSSFSDGLTGVEFFHHLKTSRVGLVGTAVSTAETGYCYRRISKCLEDIQVGFDHSIRNAANEILLQHAGFETDHVHLVSVRFLSEDIATTQFNGCDCPTCQGELRHLTKYKNTIMAMKRTYRSVHLPFDIRHLPTVVEDEEEEDAPLSCCEMVRTVQSLWTRLLAQRVPESIGPAFFDRLSSKTLRQDHGILTVKRLTRLLDYVEHRLVGSLYAPGTPIGLIASQSFSEPLTQMQLNQFHQSGEESELTGGVVRIKEILNCSQHIKTPSMRIVAVEGHIIDTRSLVEVSFHSVFDKWSDLCPETNLPSGRLYLHLHRKKMMDREVSPRQVAEALCQSIFGPKSAYPTAQVTYATINQDRWWVCVEDANLPLRDLFRHIHKHNSLISGIRNIRDAVISTMEVREVVEGRLVKRTRPYVTTLGSNLTEVFSLPWVDKRHTTTNDQMEVYAELGIDAACRCIEEELVQIMMSNTASVIRKYVRIISTTICRTGIPCALTFAGLTNSNTSILKLATFERSLESFTRAAMNGHVDTLQGTSESLVVGKPVNLGTGGQFAVVSTMKEQPRVAKTWRRGMEWEPVTTALPMDIEKLTYLPLVHARPSLEETAVLPLAAAPTTKKTTTKKIRPPPPASHSSPAPKRKKVIHVSSSATVSSSDREIHVDSQGGLIPRRHNHQ